ncbi:MAG: inositol monophosphatase [Bacteroidales bacterium]|nr:inositol monophosphatase [Bacteroidales bacterium]
MSEIIDHQKACEAAMEVARRTGRYIFSHINRISSKDIESKGRSNFVTEIDRTAESMIIEALTPVIPEAGFIAEEGTSEKKGFHYNWIIDPLDGTTNFIHGAPPVSVSIALMSDDQIVAGVVYEIWHNELFYSWKEGEAFLNGNRIRVSAVDQVRESLIATGFPYENFDRIVPFMKSLDYFFRNTHGVRRLGSAAADLAYVACGRYDAFYEYNLNPWDVAAGAFIVLQAGGKVSDFRGGNDYLFGREIVASNSNVFGSFLQNVGTFMNQIQRCVPGEEIT